MSWTSMKKFAIGLAFLVLLALVACDEDTNVPFAIIATPTSGARENVELSFLLRDSNSEAVGIVLFGQPGLFTPTRAPGEDGTNIFLASPGGTTHTIVWDSLTDVGVGRHEVSFSIAPVQGSTIGTGSSTLPFIVSNVELFVLESVKSAIAGRHRAAHVRLADGRVLISGGLGLSLAPVPDAELFDPVTRTYTNAPGSPIARDGHTATILGDGRALLVGGRTNAGVTSKVELFDPQTGTFSSGPGLRDPRTDHLAVPLLDGDVLVIGGRDGGGQIVDTAERYDLQSGSWQGPFALSGGGRVDFTATRRRDGTVFLAGGSDGSTTLSTSLLFDPQTNGFSNGPTLPEGRKNHAAVLLADGRVLLSGGFGAGGTVLGQDRLLNLGGTSFSAVGNRVSHPRVGAVLLPLPDERILLFGGTDGQGTVLETSVFDPLKNEWSDSNARLRIARQKPVAELLGTGHFFVVDGGGESPSLFYPERSNVDRIPIGVAQVRSSHQSTLLPNSETILTGGTTGTGPPLRDATFFRANSSGESMRRAQMTIPRRDHRDVRLADGRLLITGGRTTGGGVTDGTEIYATATDAFTSAATMTSGRAEHSGTLLFDGRVVLGGGTDGTQTLGSIETYDPASDSFTAASATMSPRRSHRALRLPDGRVMFAGGVNGSGGPPGDVAIYDPDADSVTSIGLTTPRSHPSVVLLPDGRVWIAGGVDGGGTTLASTELVDPTAGSVVSGPSLGFARSEGSAFLRTDGTIWVVGGRNGDGHPTGRIDVLSPSSLTVTTSTERFLQVPRTGQTLTPHAALLLVSGGVDSEGRRLGVEILE